jgi:predicted phage terminase large subunit-like protein
MATAQVIYDHTFKTKSERDEFPFDVWQEAREKCKRDLWYLSQILAKEEIGKSHNLLIERVHKPICELFVHKDPCKTIAEQDLQYKDRLLLYPRGTLKSTIDRYDAVQWILCFPDIRILILTGEAKLAKDFVRRIKNLFRVREGHESLFQKLFPEYLIGENDQESDEKFYCPCREADHEPTVWANSIGANLSGWHCDVMKCDDVLTDENSRTQDGRETLQIKFDTVGELLEPWGYRDIIGTRYAPDDLYGVIIKRSTEESNPLLYACQSSWKVKAHAVQKNIFELTPEDVDLLFAEKLPFKVLRKKLLSNETVFRCQQLNEPVAGSDITFDLDVLHAHQCQLSAVPDQGTIFVSWDWAMSGASSGDMSCGAVGKVTEDGKLFILELVFGRFKPSELAFQIVNLTKKYAPKVTVIEKSNGAELLQLEIQRQAMLYNVALNIHWAVVSNEKDAKRNRIKGLEVLLNSNRLWFAPGPWIDKTFDQFHRYTGERKNKGRHDDIPDAIAYLQLFVPSNVAMTDDEKKAVDDEEEKRIAEERARAYHAMMFATRGDNDPTDELLPTMPDRTPRSALNDVFGGNGMHV